MTDGTGEGAEKNENGGVEGVVKETWGGDEGEMVKESCKVLAKCEEKCCMAEVCWWDGKGEDEGREGGNLVRGKDEEEEEGEKRGEKGCAEERSWGCYWRGVEEFSKEQRESGEGEDSEKRG